MLASELGKAHEVRGLSIKQKYNFIYLYTIVSLGQYMVLPERLLALRTVEKKMLKVYFSD